MRRLFVIAVMCAAACKSQQLTTSSSLATPIGLTVAGHMAPGDTSANLHLFIAQAEEDTVQMLNLPAKLSHTTFVRGPARYFPLRIPAGVRPTKLASSQDGHYVVVLDSGTSTLLLIDADQFLKAVDSEGNEISFELSDAGSIPTDMVAQPVQQPEPGCQDNVPSTCPLEACSAGADIINGKVYVALAADGVILELELHDVCDGASRTGEQIVPTGVYNVGGQPQHLALSPLGDFLFVTDAVATTITRITLQGGATDTLEVGDAAGPIAVTRDGDVLLVGRARWQDVLVIQDATSPSWSIFDANALHAPSPICLTDCATGMNVDDLPYTDPTDTSKNRPGSPCGYQHPADAAICADHGSLQLRTVYPAISVDGVPTLITTLSLQGAGTFGPNYPLVYSCTDGDVDQNNDGIISDEENNRNSAISISRDEYALVVTEGDRTTGDMVWMPLRNFVGGPLTPEIANGACGKAALDVDARFVSNNAKLDDFGPYQIANYMDHCVPVPDRARFSCVEDIGGGGAVILAGNLPLLAAQNSAPLSRQGRWDFTWEAIIPGLDRSSGGGEFHPDDAVFFDIALTEEDFKNVRVGDILEIMSAPNSSAQCLADLDAGVGSEATQLCSLERTITDKFVGGAVDDNGQPVDLTVDPADPLLLGHTYFHYSGAKIPASCFLGGGRVGYRIRTGNQFLVVRNGFQPWRMTLQDVFGPGGTVTNAQHEPAIFKFRPDLLNMTDGSACERYDVNGHVLDTNLQSEVLSRDVRFAMIITDAFRPYVSGRTYSATGTTLGSAGSIPGDIYVFQDISQDVPAKLFVSYSGANTLVGMNPTDASQATEGLIDTQIILQN